MGKWWTKEEIEILKDQSKNYNQLAKMLPYRKRCRIKAKCQKLKLTSRPNTRSQTLHEYFMTELEAKDLLEDQEFCEMVDGCLLGDACLDARKKFRFNTANKEYLVYLADYFTPLLRSKTRPKQYNKGKYRLFSLGYSRKVVFKHFYKRWYPYGIKIVPKDIKLTPLTCKCWYIDDGSLSAVVASHVAAFLHTQCFAKKEIIRLLEQLNDCVRILSRISFARLSKKGKPTYKIAIYGKDVIRFLKYIGGCPVNSYRYKWNIKNYKRFVFSCPYCSIKVSHCGFAHLNKRKTCGSQQCLKEYLREREKKRKNKNLEKNDCLSVCSK